MQLNLGVPQPENHLTPKITVFGCGGAGGNAVNNMIRAELQGVDFVVANTDAQALEGSLCARRIQLGRHITSGLGAGADPGVGQAAAEESIEEILAEMSGANMVFVTAGMGGGTGTGAAPVIARAARESGILTVGVVTKPFNFEGLHRMRLAEAGMEALQDYVDTLIIIPNQNLFRIANEKTTFADAFKLADDVLHSGVRGVTDLMVMPGLINLDFADIRTVMREMGKAMMGTGQAEGEHRAVEAAEAAISNPLLDEVSMKGARGVLINITGGLDMTLFEVDEAANRIRDEVDPDANIIFGSTFDPGMEGEMRVSVVATGIDVREATADKPHRVAASRPAPQRPAPVSQRGADAVAAIRRPVAPAAAASRAVAEARPAAVEEAPVAMAEAEELPEQSDLVAEVEAEIAAEMPQAQSAQMEAAEPRMAAAGGGGRVATAASAQGRGEGRSAVGSWLNKLRGSRTTAREDAAPAQRSATTRRPVPASTAAPARPVAQPTPASRQPALKGLDGEAAPEAQHGSDDLLEIPAFLRRQAN